MLWVKSIRKDACSSFSDSSLTQEGLSAVRAAAERHCKKGILKKAHTAILLKEEAKGNP